MDVEPNVTNMAVSLEVESEENPKIIPLIDAGSTCVKNGKSHF